MRQCLLKRFSREAVWAVSSKKVQYTVEAVEACHLKRFSMEAAGAVTVKRFSMEAVEVMSSQKVQYGDS